MNLARLPDWPRLLRHPLAQIVAIQAEIGHSYRAATVRSTPRSPDHRTHGARTMAAKPIPELSPDNIARFWAKVDVRGPDECWPWLAGDNGKGYGLFKIGTQARRSNHIALIFSGTPRPDGMHALHSCDKPRCCNPAHLRWGTHQENMMEREARGRTWSTRNFPRKVQTPKTDEQKKAICAKAWATRRKAKGDE